MSVSGPSLCTIAFQCHLSKSSLHTNCTSKEEGLQHSLILYATIQHHGFFSWLDILTKSMEFSCLLRLFLMNLFLVVVEFL